MIDLLGQLPGAIISVEFSRVDEKSSAYFLGACTRILFHDMSDRLSARTL
jgi:hypothetical protein